MPRRQTRISVDHAEFLPPDHGDLALRVPAVGELAAGAAAARLAIRSAGPGR
jgi:hypothetical protein